MSERVKSPDFLLDFLGEPIIGISSEKKIVYLNSPARALLGEPDSLVGRDCCDTLGLSICVGGCPVSGLVEGEVKYDYMVTRRDDDKVYCVSTSVVDDGAGGVRYLHVLKDMKFLSDIIERQKEIHTILELGRARMEAILESIADGVFSVDESGRIRHFSIGMEKITGFTQEEVLGKPCREVLRGNICESDCPISWSLERRKKVERCREIILRKDGVPVPVFVTTSLIWHEGEFKGIVCTVHDRTEVENLKRELERAFLSGEMVGSSKKMRELFERIETVSTTDATVLIEGETGTGKELVARAIHEKSPRKNGPFVTVNCSALSHFLLESELFGHVRGAFTGAHRDKPGKFELAHGGTLFLDEISEISTDVQVKLLRFLQFREFERVGDTRTRKVDVRILAATNRDLKTLVREGKFREDLYYRINVIPVKVPPLRERKEDIPLLVHHFLGKHGNLNPSVEGISNRALEMLMRYHWPGNVRELENAVIYALTSCRGSRIKRECLPPDIRGGELLENSENQSGVDDLEEVEKRRVVDALLRNNWKVTRAASELGYSRVTLWRRMRKFGICLPNRCKDA